MDDSFNKKSYLDSLPNSMVSVIFDFVLLQLRIKGTIWHLGIKIFGRKNKTIDLEKIERRWEEYPTEF